MQDLLNTTQPTALSSPSPQSALPSLPEITLPPTVQDVTPHTKCTFFPPLPQPKEMSIPWHFKKIRDKPRKLVLMKNNLYRANLQPLDLDCLVTVATISLKNYDNYKFVSTSPFTSIKNLGKCAYSVKPSIVKSFNYVNSYKDCTEIPEMNTAFVCNWLSSDCFCSVTEIEFCTVSPISLLDAMFHQISHTEIPVVPLFCASAHHEKFVGSMIAIHNASVTESLAFTDNQKFATIKKIHTLSTRVPPSLFGAVHTALCTTVTLLQAISFIPFIRYATVTKCDDSNGCLRLARVSNCNSLFTTITKLYIQDFIADISTVPSLQSAFVLPIIEGFADTVTEVTIEQHYCHGYCF